MPVRPSSRTSGARPTGASGATTPKFEVLSTTGGWDYFHMMLFGPPGIGKTWLAGTSIQVPELRPVLLCDNDGGSKTLRGKKQFAGVDIVRVYHYEAYNEIYALLVENKKGWKTVIIDNFGALHQLAMDLEMESVMKKDSTREEFVPSQREYGIVRGQLHKLVRFFRELNINLIITAHAELDRDDVTGIVRIRPAVSGKLAYEIPGFMDVVGYMEAKRRPRLAGGKEKENEDFVAERMITFQPVGRVEVKDESDALGITMTNPTMAEIYRRLPMNK